MSSIIKKSFINKSEKYILNGFLSADYPKFAKSNKLANENVEYLLGLSQRCLNGDKELSFPLSITMKEEEEIRQYIINIYDLPDEWLFFYLMKSVRIILEKYYSKNGQLFNK
jgi:hypothetical protein